MFLIWLIAGLAVDAAGEVAALLVGGKDGVGVEVGTFEVLTAGGVDCDATGVKDGEPVVVVDAKFGLIPL